MPPENQNPISVPVPAKAGMHWILKVFLVLVVLGILGIITVVAGGYFLLRNSSIDEKMPWGIPDGKYVYKTTSDGQEAGANVLEAQGSKTIIISGRQKLTTTKDSSAFLGGAKSEGFKYQELSAAGKIVGVECKKIKVALAKTVTGREEAEYNCKILGQSPVGFRPGLGFIGADKPETIGGVDCVCGNHGCHAKDYPALTCRENIGFSMDSQNKVELFSQLTGASFGSQMIDLSTLPLSVGSAIQSIDQ